MKPKLLLFLAVLVVSCGGQKAVVKHGAFGSTGEDLILAILPLGNNSPDRSLDAAGATLSGLISERLASRKVFKVVERQKIEKLLGELKLQQAGVTDPDTALRVGKLLGANVLAFGSFSSFGNKVVLTLRLVKVETGEIAGGVSERGADIARLDVLAENAAGKLADALARE